MKKIINSLVMFVAVIVSMAATSASVAAQTSEPIITFKTNIYEQTGELNSFSLVLGGTEPEQYIDIDCGFGPVEYVLEQAVYDEETSSITGTFIECKVSSEGIVKIYGDADKIDYINASGCYIDWIDMSKCKKIDFLDLSHNELKSLDLSHMTELSALYLSDNEFTAETPLVIGGNKPNLRILEVSIIEHMDQSFNLSDYPALISFDGYHNRALKHLDPTGCPELLRLTLDVTDVETLDVTKNPNLMILNISDTRVTSIDVSKNPYLTQLYCTHQGSINGEYKLTSLDVTNNPEIVYLFCAGNKLTSLDVTKCPNLITLIASDNYISSIDVSNNPQLYIFEINKNCLDFATLPFPKNTWNTYNYGQRNFDIVKSCAQGTSFDFSERVLREGTTTEAVLYSVSETSGSTTMLDESYFSYENGVFKVTKACEDSVYIAFANNMFPDAIMRTDKFKVKVAADMGLDDKVIDFSTSIEPNKAISFSVGALGATPENPVEFFVDFGNGKKVSCKATSFYAPETANVSGLKAEYGNVYIYAPEGVQLTAFASKDLPMYSVDVTKAPALRELSIVNAGLYSVDLSMNRCLESLNLSGNNISMLNLEGVNGDYSKNLLSNINLSNNRITDLTLNDMRAIRTLNLSNNQLSTLDLSFGDYIVDLNISNNKYEELNLTYCLSMKRLDISHNNISSVIMPTENNLEYFACNNNKFTYATLPAHGNIAEANYIYAPQADIVIASKGPNTDLSEQLTAHGTETQYTWKKADGNVLTEGVDYTISNGLTKFVNINVGKIYCEMTNAAYPAFSNEKVLKTTLIEAAGMPTNVIAEFTTVNDADSVSLSLAAAKDGIAIYIDWAGDGNVAQYLLTDAYRLFSAKTVAGANVKAYTYEANEAITVFSITGAKMSSFDGTNLKDAINISVNGAGLSEIALPENSNILSEMSLEGNNFTEFDLAKFPALKTVALGANQLTTIDFSKAPKLEVASAANNQLTEVILGNSKLWGLYLDTNKLSKIDFTGAPNISQLTLSHNLFSELDVESLNSLKMLTIDNNYFTFKTLPLHKENYILYYYYGQAPIDAQCINGVVDLSDQAYVDGTETTYRWFIDVPVVNDEGELEGEELIIDEEYILENGVTTFLTSIEDVMCVMTNSKLPNVYIFTNLLDVVSGIEDIYEDGNNASVEYYNLQGIKVENPEKGLYIRVQGNKVAKVLIKK